MCSNARAQVTDDVVTWTAPTMRADGSPLSAAEILQYRITWSKVAGGPYTAGSAIIAGNLLTWTRAGRTAGRACYVLVTIDTGGLESALSTESCTEKCSITRRVNAAGDCVLIPVPGPATNLRAQ